MPKKLFVFLLVILPIVSIAQEEKRKLSFKDTLDGKLDASQFLDEYNGFVPIVMPITEPAVGYGAAGALIFVRRKRDETGIRKDLNPDIYGAGAMYTENKSYAFGGAYSGHWNEDKIRANFVAGYGSLNLKYYRTDPDLGELNFGMNVAATFIQADISHRLGKIPLYAGLRYSFAGSRVKFDIGNDVEIPGVNDAFFDADFAGLAPLLSFDTRDYIFTPNKGVKADLMYVFNDKAFGGTVVFQRLNLHTIGYTPLSDNLIGGLRIHFQAASDDTPFYALPFIEMRGIPAMRYQGSRVYAIETEERYNFNLRWAAVGFAGVGKGVLPNQSWADSKTAWAVGGGFRYLLARVFNMYGGVDIARGNEDWAIYFTVGTNWNRL